MRILVCGLRGSGKSTWAKEHLGDGVAYDMDAIASAFRLRMPHEEYHARTRQMANDMLPGFLAVAEEYGDPVIIIRTAPTISEAQEIDPDLIVILYERHVIREMDDERSAMERLHILDDWATRSGVRVLHDSPTPRGTLAL